MTNKLSLNINMKKNSLFSLPQLTESNRTSNLNQSPNKSIISNRVLDKKPIVKRKIIVKINDILKKKKTSEELFIKLNKFNKKLITTIENNTNLNSLVENLMKFHFGKKSINKFEIFDINLDNLKQYTCSIYELMEKNLSKDELNILLKDNFFRQGEIGKFLGLNKSLKLIDKLNEEENKVIIHSAKRIIEPEFNDNEDISNSIKIMSKIAMDQKKILDKKKEGMIRSINKIDDILRDMQKRLDTNTGYFYRQRMEIKPPIENAFGNKIRNINSLNDEIFVNLNYLE